MAANLLRRLDEHRDEVLANDRKQGEGMLEVLTAAFDGPALDAGRGRPLNRLATFAPCVAIARTRPAPHARLPPNDHPLLPPNAIETLVALVTAGELDGELHLLYNTIGDRIEAVEAAWWTSRCSNRWTPSPSSQSRNGTTIPS
jgi:hypothetical protein